MTRQSRFSSVNNAGDTTREDVDGRAPPGVGHGGKSTSSSIERRPIWRWSARIPAEPPLSSDASTTRRRRAEDSRDMPRWRGRSGQGSCRVPPQIGDGGEVHEPASTAGQHRQPLFGGRQCAGQELALGAVELEREGEVAVPLPAILGQQLPTGCEVGQRRVVGRRLFGALAREQMSSASCTRSAREVIKAAPRLSWLTISKMASSRLPAAYPRPASADPEVHGGAPFGRNQRVGSLVDAIVDETVGTLEEIDQLLAPRLNEAGVQLLLGRVVNDRQHRDGRDIARQASCCSAAG